MNNSDILKKIAQQTPAIGRILKEKSVLYETTKTQEKHIRVLEKQKIKLQNEIAGRSSKKIKPIWPLLEKEILKASQGKSTIKNHAINHQPPFVLNWILPAVVTSSGGQSDIFRTIKFLTDHGHDCSMYIFDPHERSSLSEQKKLIAAGFPGLSNKVYYNAKTITDCDVIFATHWLTAYPVHNFNGKGRKYYYVQGYEPHTQPAGYLSYLAESTYTFGFRGLTLGQWLTDKLSKEYQMKCDFFDYGYDPDEYSIKSTQPRKDIIYYAQPQKAHRGFELGMMALKIFHRENPSSKIHLFGADLRSYEIPFPHEDLGILSVPQLNELYNRCAAGLALSFTNISLIPLEMIAAGCQPVINDSYHTRKIKYADWVKYADPNPIAIAEALSKATRANRQGLRIKLEANYSWDHSNQQIENILIKELAT